MCQPIFSFHLRFYLLHHEDVDKENDSTIQILLYPTSSASVTGSKLVKLSSVCLFSGSSAT